ncbi:MAG: hypothetical protein WCO81_09335 [Cyanobacteriota bacterium ELA615]|jgi:hypothetical protein
MVKLLFRYNDQGAQELKGKSALVEKHIQNLIEKREAFSRDVSAIGLILIPHSG